MKKTAVVLLSLFFFLLVPGIVRAEEESGRSAGSIFNFGTRRDSVREKVKETVKENVREKSCEARADMVRDRSEKLVAKAKEMEEKFVSIVDRVKGFYTDKVVPAGGVVSNYDALLADIDAKKATLDTAIADAESKAGSFNCTDPSQARAQVNEFKASMQKVITSLKELRVSVKNFIVAVKGAARVLTPSPSPES